MKAKRLFLQWSLFVTLMIVSAAIAMQLGWIEQLFRSDTIHLVYLTITMFVLATAWCGYLCWKLGGAHDTASITHAVEHSRYAAGVCWKLGILGTVVGYFLVVLQPAGGGGDASVQLAHQIRSGMAVSLSNTIVGLVCVVLIEAQLHLIWHAMEKPKTPGTGGAS